MKLLRPIRQKEDHYCEQFRFYSKVESRGSLAALTAGRDYLSIDGVTITSVPKPSALFHLGSGLSLLDFTACCKKRHNIQRTEATFGVGSR